MTEEDTTARIDRITIVNDESRAVQLIFNNDGSITMKQDDDDIIISPYLINMITELMLNHHVEVKNTTKGEDGGSMNKFIWDMREDINEIIQRISVLEAVLDGATNHKGKHNDK